MTQLSLIPTPKAEPTPEIQPFQEVTFNPKDTCSQYPCYDPEKQRCSNPSYGYGIDPKLAAKQRLCDIDDDKTEAGK